MTTGRIMRRITRARPRAKRIHGEGVEMSVLSQAELVTGLYPCL